MQEPSLAVRYYPILKKLWTNGNRIFGFPLTNLTGYGTLKKNFYNIHANLLNKIKSFFLE
ncbi:hypothetical protein EEL30_11035 [Brevibacillus laterosporus]|uniref:Uncharacterized protein n=1 Tax=Brevibacillus laterosporus TaxID=1465 RepID=A0A518V743_BRELA|nr:hypothetical protein EEL30_11035 [Brevibacillus laterosporus]